MSEADAAILALPTELLQTIATLCSSLSSLRLTCTAIEAAVRDVFVERHFSEVCFFVPNPSRLQVLHDIVSSDRLGSRLRTVTLALSPRSTYSPFCSWPAAQVNDEHYSKRYNEGLCHPRVAIAQDEYQKNLKRWPKSQKELFSSALQKMKHRSDPTIGLQFLPDPHTDPISSPLDDIMQDIFREVTAARLRISDLLSPNHRCIAPTMRYDPTACAEMASLSTDLRSIAISPDLQEIERVYGSTHVSGASATSWGFQSMLQASSCLEQLSILISDEEDWERGDHQAVTNLSISLMTANPYDHLRDLTLQSIDVPIDTFLKFLSKCQNTIEKMAITQVHLNSQTSGAWVEVLKVFLSFSKLEMLTITEAYETLESNNITFLDPTSDHLAHYDELSEEERLRVIDLGVDCEIGDQLHLQCDEETSTNDMVNWLKWNVGFGLKWNL